MRTDRPRYRRIATLILALVAIALWMSVFSAQVRADASHFIPDVPGVSVSGYGSMPLLADVATTTPTASQPFTCSMLSLSNKRLFGNEFRIDIQNDNDQPTIITRVQITWPNIPAFAQTGLTQMSLNTLTMWNGPDPQNMSSATTITDTNTKPGNPPFLNTTTDRILQVRSANVYGASFNGPPLLATYVSVNQYTIIFTIDNPLNVSSPCLLASSATVPTATPTFSGQPSPTVTSTPDCASGPIAIRFNSFESFGIVRFDILNQRTSPLTLKSFNINWQKYVNSQRLAQVSLGAPPGITGATVVWNSGNVNLDADSPTNSQTEGTWLTDFTMPAGALGAPSLTPIYLDFDGIYRYDDYYSSTNPRYGGASDFNYSTFELTCDAAVGQPVVQVTPEIIPSLTPIPTQSGGTQTPTPTSTPSPRPTSTSTLSPPPTVTLAPTPTLLNQPSPTITTTPDCVSGPITIKFNSFDNFGIVRFDLLNQRSSTLTLVSFNINWQKYVNSQRLAQVSLGDPPYNSNAVIVWNSGDINQDSNPPTNSQTEGTWLTNFTIPAGALGAPSITPIYLDFDGIYRYDDFFVSTNPRYGGVSDFNFSAFKLTCDAAGGQPVLQVTPEVIPSPTPPPLPTLTSTPKPLIRNYFTTHTPSLSWTRVSWAARYEIQVSTDINFASLIVDGFVLADTLSYTTPVLSDGTFYWRVRALDAHDMSSGWSEVDSFYVAPPPTAPSGN